MSESKNSVPLFGHLYHDNALYYHDITNPYYLNINKDEKYCKLLNDIFLSFRNTTTFNSYIQFQWTYSFACYTHQTIAKLAGIINTQKTIEVGAGRGLLAHLLSYYNIHIDCYDNFSWFHVTVKEAGNYYNVIEKDHKSIDFDGYNILILCWPPPNTNMASESLLAFSGDTLIYFGEIEEKKHEKCQRSEKNTFIHNDELYIIPETGDKMFHTLLQEKFYIEESISIPGHGHFQDKLFIYKRKK